MHTKLLATLLTLGVSACSGMQTPETVLEDQLREFHAHLRWGRFEEAGRFVAESGREDFIGMYEELGDDFEITEFEMESVQLVRGSDTAAVTVWMQWFRLPSTRVVEATYHEVWEYSRDSRTWLMTERVAEDD